MEKETIKLIFNDFKFLIKHTNEKLNSSACETEKGLSLITTYATANSLYEKYISIILDQISKNYNKDLRSNSKKVFLLKYRDGKKLHNLNKNEIDFFLNNIKKEKFHSEFKKTHKSLKHIKSIFDFITITSLHQKQINRILVKRNLDLQGLFESLKRNYENDRTNIIHGEYRDIKTLYFIYRQTYKDFLINLYIAMKIIEKSL